MEAILENLVRSPKFPRYVDELIELRQREDAARQRFRNSTDEEGREEFINGEVVRHMPARHSHSMAIRNIGRVLSLHVEQNRLGAVVTEQAITGFTRNDYSPDICFWSVEKAGKIEGKTTIYPIPDFVCEVLSPSTEERDRGVKFEDYAAHGVREYCLVDPDRRIIEQYLERSGRYELVGKFTEGMVRGIAVTRFEIPVLAAFDDQANIDLLRILLGPQ